MMLTKRYLCIHLCIRIFTYMYVYMHVYIHTCIHTSSCTHVHIHIYTHIHIHICIYIYICICIYIHIHIPSYKKKIHACTTCTHVCLSLELSKNRPFGPTPTANSIILLSGLIACCTFSIPLNFMLLGLSRAHTRAYDLILTPAFALFRSHEDSFPARARVHALSLSNTYTH